jgi:arylsulfatase A-like enzyme
VRALYRGEVAEVDRQVGRVLRALDARGLRDRTLVVVVSDHGEEFWEHGGVEHGHTLYDEVLKVVMLVSWPGKLPGGARVGSVTSLVDVVPTIHDLLGLDHPPASDGISLVPLIRGETVPERAVLSENLLFAEDRVSVRTDRTKLVRWENGKEEAYDLARDPGEIRDLAGVEPFVASLRDELDELAEAGDLRQAMAATTMPSAESAIPVGALRALGYVQ